MSDASKSPDPLSAGLGTCCLRGALASPLIRWVRYRRLLLLQCQWQQARPTVLLSTLSSEDPHPPTELAWLLGLPSFSGPASTWRANHPQREPWSQLNPSSYLVSDSSSSFLPSLFCCVAKSFFLPRTGFFSLAFAHFAFASWALIVFSCLDCRF